MKGVFFINNPQQIADAIRNEAKKQGITIGSLLRECGLSKNALSSMNSGHLPQLENLVSIAEKLGCSLDYLLGIEKAAADDPVRDGISKQIRNLSDDQARQLLAFLEALASG